MAISGEFFLFGFAFTLALISFSICKIKKPNKKPTSSVLPTNWPVVGMLPALLRNSHRIHAYVTDVLSESGGTFEIKFPRFLSPDMLATCDPANIHHIFSRNFSNYPKGPEFRKIFEILGDGIFNADFELWELHRKTTLSFFTHPSFHGLLEKSVWENVENALLPVLDSFAARAASFDLQDVFQRFTFDSICKIVLDHDPRSLLMFAGRDTTSTCLTWLFWLVSRNPSVEARILEEIEQGGCSSRRFGAEESKKLVYLHGALCESLRLFPPVALEHKAPAGPDFLPSGHYVETNTKVIISFYSTGRMKGVWGEDFMEFKPERWVSGKGGVNHVPSYRFPAFNAGPRTCLGKEMAFVQMKMVAAAILWRYKVRVVEGHAVVPRDSIILQARDGLRVQLSRRRRINV
ncbi:cytochrome P450- family 96- subfamily A-polypeptide 10 [Striga hermonthica]|uniref:Cytochrome P450- family 96- subfamily A-polypeptide 10 n=1 Tax=Striga hermonthica TaxID=68872 RepID=A0A9N7MUW4_STRHE|nr:cytochrome P450- family 96- subfamily A-polypeptide 10 [Striga hermonthica]